MELGNGKKQGISIIGNKGFTMVEMLVVIFIIGLLVVALTPTMSQVSLNGKIDSVEADLRVFAMDINNYILDYGGVFIDGCEDLDTNDLNSESRNLLRGLNSYIGNVLENIPTEAKNGVNADGSKYCRVVVETKYKVDPWGNAYKVLIDPRGNNIIVTSSGPNTEFEIDKYPTGDFGDDILVIIRGK